MGEELMKKSQKNMFSIILFLALFFIITYTYIDNNRINIVQEEVVINNLPSEFEGFKILQISDLHGKSFGKLQKHLSEKINSIDYDIIAITGDMKDVHSDNIDPDRKSTRLNSSHNNQSRMPSSA